MSEKECTKCLVVKPFSEFYKHSGRNDGMHYDCKSCGKEQESIYHKTKKGLVSRIYRDQRAHSRARQHYAPPYSLDELRKWCFSQPLFHKLYDKWVESGYDKMRRPSCDRTDDSLGYSLDRLGVMTWKENSDKADRDTINGILKRSTKPVIQMSVSGRFIKEWYSQSHAFRTTGVMQTDISSCCRGRRKTAGGFKWCYATNEVK